MKKILFLFFIIQILYIVPIQELYRAQCVIILDPAGDAKRTGRSIGDAFERGLTLQCAEKIKEIIELQAPYIKVIITRLPGDMVYDLQNASLANRLNADLFINLNFYHSKETKPTLYLYQFSYGNDFAPLQRGLALHTYDQAYRINKTKTDDMAQLFKQSLLDQKYQSLFALSGIHQAPIKPLIGIVAPSISIEAGLKNKEMWLSYCQPIAQSIIAVMNKGI